MTLMHTKVMPHLLFMPDDDFTGKNTAAFQDAAARAFFISRHDCPSGFVRYYISPRRVAIAFLPPMAGMPPIPT